MRARAQQPFFSGLLVATLFLVGLLACREDPFQKSQALIRDHAYQSAIEMLRQYYVKHPYSDEAPEALHRIGEVYRVHLKNMPKAVEAYRILSRRFSEHEIGRNASFLLADLYSRHMQDPQQAIVEYQRITSHRFYNDEEKAKAAYLSGVAYYSLGKLGQAQIEFQKILDQNKSQDPELIANTKLQLANTMSVGSNCDGALKVYTSLLKNARGVEPSLLEQAKFGEASCYAEMENYEVALKRFKKILNTYPSKEVVEIRIRRIEQRMLAASK